MKQAAFVMLTAAALTMALSSCGGAGQNAAQKARRAAIEAEEKARRALIKAAPAEWEAYRKNGREAYRNNNLSPTQQFILVEIPNGGYDVEYFSDLVKTERDTLIQAAPAEWDAYIAAHNAANAARQTMWTAALEAEAALRNAASGEWKTWKAAIRLKRLAQATNDRALKHLEKALKPAEAEAALKQAAPEQWNTYKAALSEVKKLGQRSK